MTGQNGRGPVARVGRAVGQKVKDKQKSYQKKGCKFIGSELVISICVNKSIENTCENTRRHTRVAFNKGNTLAIIFQQEAQSGWMFYELGQV